MEVMKKVVLLTAVFLTLFIATPIHAQQSPSATPILITVMPSTTPCIASANGGTGNCIQVDERQLGFEIPTLSRILTFTLRLFFIIGGLAALVMLLLGAFAWITSGGEKDKVSAAQQKIQAAVLGLIMIVVVLAIVVTLEQVVFAGKLCFGLSCPITLPSLLKEPGSSSNSINEPFKLLDDTPTPVPTTSSANVSPSQLQNPSTVNPTSDTSGNMNTVIVPQVPNSGMAQ